jgi:hypothetical protein
MKYLCNNDAGIKRKTQQKGKGRKLWVLLFLNVGATVAITAPDQTLKEFGPVSKNKYPLSCVFKPIATHFASLMFFTSFSRGIL